MAKLPGWLKYEGMTLDKESNQAVMHIRIRRWHPMYWWLLLRKWINV